MQASDSSTKVVCPTRQINLNCLHGKAGRGWLLELGCLPRLAVAPGLSACLAAMRQSCLQRHCRHHWLCRLLQASAAVAAVLALQRAWARCCLLLLVGWLTGLEATPVQNQGPAQLQHSVPISMPCGYKLVWYQQIGTTHQPMLTCATQQGIRAWLQTSASSTNRAPARLDMLQVTALSCIYAHLLP